MISFEELLVGYSNLSKAIHYQMVDGWPILEKEFVGKLRSFKDGAYLLSGMKGVSKTLAAKEGLPNATYVGME